MKKIIGLWLIIVIVFAGAIFIYKQLNEPDLITDSKSVSTNNSSEEQQKTITSEKQKEENPKKIVKITEVIDVSDVNESLRGRNVTLRGIARNVKKPKKTVFFDLEDSKNSNISIKGVLFNKTNIDNPGRKNLLEKSMNNNMEIFVEGLIDEYKGSIEIKAWKVYIK